MVSSALSIGEVNVDSEERVWSSDPTAGCEISEDEDSLHQRGSFGFVMAANQAEPVALAAEIYLAPEGRITPFLGLYARGHNDWQEKRNACSVALKSYDFEARSFAFTVDCTFERNNGTEAIDVQGEIATARCFDPTAISFQTVGELADSIGSTTANIGNALAEDPIGFAKTIALLPLYAAGGH